MDRFKMLAVFVGVLIFTEGAGVIYFAHKSQGLSKELESVRPELKGHIEGLKREKQEAEAKYVKLLKENESVKRDRENLLAQTKYLLKEKGGVKGLKESLDKLQAEKKEIEERLQTERKEIEERLKAGRGQFASALKEVKRQNTKLQGVIKQLMYIQKELEQERDYLKEAYGKLKDKSTVKEFKKTVSTLTRENKQLNNKLKLAQREIDKLKELDKKANVRIEDLEKDADEYKENYAKAARKNKALEREVRDMPKKFSEIARQNKSLIKETARTHYNLGVFYTKNKEYSRASTEFAKAVELNPNDAHSHFNIGYIYAEHLLNRRKAIEHFRHFLRLAKGGDKDIDWVRKYVLAWDTFEGKTPFK